MTLAIGYRNQTYDDAVPLYLETSDGLWVRNRRSNSNVGGWIDKQTLLDHMADEGYTPAPGEIGPPPFDWALGNQPWSWNFYPELREQPANGGLDLTTPSGQLNLLRYVDYTGGLGTFHDSAGKLVHNAHNLAQWSEDFAQWGPFGLGNGLAPIISADTSTPPVGSVTQRAIFDLDGNTTSGDISRIRMTYVATGLMRAGVWLRSFDGVSSYNMQITTADFNTLEIVVTGTWTFFYSETSYSGSTELQVRLRGGVNPVNSDVADVLIAAGQIYRSDIDMAPNPDTGDSYVKTEAAAVYMPRVGAHVWVETLPPQPILGPELWDNQDVIVGANWSDNGDGSYTHSAGSTATTSQAASITAGNSYFVSYKTTNTSAGIFRALVGSTSLGTWEAGDGEYSEILTAAGASAIYLACDTNFVGTMEIQSVRELLGYTAAEGHWGPSRLRTESEARTNLVGDNNDLTAFTGGGVTAIAGQAVGPDGQLSMSSVVIDDDADTPRQLYKDNPATPTNVHTASVFLLAGTQRYVAIRLYVKANRWVVVVCDLDTHAVTQASSGTGGTLLDYDLVDVGPDLMLLHVSASFDEGTSIFTILDCHATGTPILLSDSGVNSAGNLGGNVFYAGFWQLEEAPTASSLIITNDTAVTRPAELFIQPWENLGLPGDGTDLFTGLTTLGAGWVDNGDGSYTSDGTQLGNSDAIQTSLTVLNAGYVIDYEVIGRTAGAVLVEINSGSATGPTRSVNGRYIERLKSDADGGSFGVQADADFIGTVRIHSIERVSMPTTLGPELVLNGDFTTADNWTFGDGWSWEDGAAMCDGVQAFTTLVQSRAFASGVSYELTIAIDSTAGSFNAWLNDGSAEVLNPTGTTTVTLIAGSAGAALNIGSSNGVGKVTLVSVKEVIQAVSFAQKGLMTYADEGGTSGEDGTFLTWQADSTNLIKWYLWTGANIAFVQVAGAVNDSVVSSFSEGTLRPFSLASRHGSTFINGAHEGTLLTENTTPVALPALSTADMQLWPTFMGYIDSFEQYWSDLGNDLIQHKSKES